MPLGLRAGCGPVFARHDGLAEFFEGPSQFGIRYRGELLFERCKIVVRGFGRCRSGLSHRRRNRTLVHAQTRNGTETVKPVDSFDDLGFEMLEFEGQRAGNPNMQSAAFTFRAAHEAERYALVTEIGTDNGSPVREDARLEKPAFAADGACCLAAFGADGAQAAGSLPCHDLVPSGFAFGCVEHARMLEGGLLIDNVRAMNSPDPATILNWYDRHARRLPWRVPPERSRHGVRAEPYHVWLSEVMLQQTTVAAVGPYFAKFLERWPTVEDLAAVDLDAVLTAWAGLGYYARARNLHKCARVVVAQHGGRFPETEAGLRELPGIGPYTAAAIASIAFDRHATPVDGNIERVMARLFAVETPMPEAKPALRAHAARMTPASRPGDYVQAVMDLGATVCTPRSPGCAICPWRENCQAFAQNLTDVLPRRTPKPERPVRRATAYWMVRRDGAVLLRRRPETGLLGGMMEVPSGPWEEVDEFRDAAPIRAEWVELPGIVEHGFTHLRLELKVMVARVDGRTKADGIWVHAENFGDHALPTLTRKVARHALAHIGKGLKPS